MKIIVAQDGSGQYTSLQAAVDALPEELTYPLVTPALIRAAEGALRVANGRL